MLSLSFSFINYMEMNHDCRVVTISANQIVATVMAEFPVSPSCGFFRNSHLCRTACIKQLNNTIFRRETAFQHTETNIRDSLDYFDGNLVRVGHSAEMC